MDSTSGIVAGIDVHKKMLAVVVGSASWADCDFKRRTFGTTTGDLEELAAWLNEQHVCEVAMESTAQYWRPVWLALEGKFRLHLAQSRSTAAPRGRKSDFLDAVRIVRRLLSNDLTLSYVPDPEQRRWRLLARTRLQLVRQRGQVQNHVEALLEETRLKLSSVISDLFGSSGRRILRALADGVSDPVKLARLGDKRLRVSKEQLQAALSGEIHPLHRKVLGLYLDQLELLDRQISELESSLAYALRDHQPEVMYLSEVPGVQPGSAQQIVAEWGPEAATFPSPGQLASWVGICPGRQESAAQSHSDRCAKGNRYMRRLMNQIAWAAVRTNNCYFQRLFCRLIVRLGTNKALWAVAHRLLRVIWMILHERVRYRELDPFTLDPKVIQRRKHRLVSHLRQLGYSVTLTPLPQQSNT